MTEPNKRDKAPPVAIYRALQQIEGMLTSSEEAISVCSSGPDSVLWQKWQFLKISLLVRKHWEHLPEAYFAPLLRTAIYEADPSWNQDFLKPALRAFGYRKVQEALVQYLEQGTPREQEGALRAWYWAWSPCDEDLRVKRESLLLKRSMECEDPAAQRLLIFFLSHLGGFCISPETVHALRGICKNPHTYDGEGWLGIVPFTMSHIRVRGASEVPGLATAIELNVRTYVRSQGIPGVFFFSLDINSLPMVIAARMRFAQDSETIHYTSRRAQRGAAPAHYEARYRQLPEEAPAQPGSLAEWFTERYCLYSLDKRHHLYRGNIHHLRWPLWHAELETITNTMTSPHGLTLPNTQPLLHYAPQLKVLIWPLEKVE